jgi:hypothetical protein
MARKKDEEEEIEEERPVRKNSSKKSADRGKNKLKDETRHTVIGVIFLVLAVFFIIAGFGAGGVVGASTKELLVYLLGVGYALAPLLCAILGITFMKSGKPSIACLQAFGSLLFLMGSLGLIDVGSGISHSGGVIGEFFGYIFVKPFDTLGAILFLGAILIIALIVLFDTRPTLTIFNRMI